MFFFREKVCCGIIFKGPNNEVMIYPELLNPCGGCRKPRPFSLSTSSSEECESLSRNSSSNSLSNVNKNKPPSLVSVSTTPITSSSGTIFSSPIINSDNNNNNKQKILSQVKSLTEPSTLTLNVNKNKKKKILRHQDSFTSSSDTLSEQGSSSSSSHGDTDDQSSGISSMAACDESFMTLDSDLSSTISDRLSTVSSVCLMMDVDDVSSNASTSTYDGMSHNELNVF